MAWVILAAVQTVGLIGLAAYLAARRTEATDPEPIHLQVR